MMRYAKALTGFCLIAVAFFVSTAAILFVLVMSHCALSNAQIAAGETCTQPADLFFWPVLIGMVCLFAFTEWVFLRRVLRKPERQAGR